MSGEKLYIEPSVKVIQLSSSAVGLPISDWTEATFNPGLTKTTAVIDISHFNVLAEKPQVSVIIKYHISAIEVKNLNIQN